MKNLLLLPLTALLLLFSNSSFAQKISGRLTNADGEPAGFATITLHTVSDSTLVKGTLAGEDGLFDLVGVAAGRYFIRASQVGSGEVSTGAFDYLGDDKTLETIDLSQASNQLAEVAVVARRPTIEVQADKTILNVEGTVNSTGLNALELLRKAPGVMVDNNENLVVKGKNAVRVMIDGRDVPMAGKDLAALLKGMQASDIAHIEIISNPSAKFDAAGNAGIINIKLRRNKALGTNGNFGMEGIYGESLKGGGNLSLNHRTEKFSLFGSYNNHYGTWHEKNKFYREQSGLIFDQTANNDNDSRWNGARLGADWFLNDKHTVGVLANGNYDWGDWRSKSLTKIGHLEAPGSVDSLLQATNEQDNQRSDVNFNLNYRFADTSGHTVNLDVDRGFYRIRGESYQPNYYFTPDGLTLLDERIYRNNTPTDIDIITAKGDYEQLLFKGKLGVGFKFSKVETDNTFDFFNVEDGIPVKDLDVSNRFIYKEMTSAGYLNYNRAFGKKLQVQAGLRMENTDYQGDLIASNPQGEEQVKNNYTELFPSAAITYTFTPKIGLNATYSRRIDRPSYQDLNPFEAKLDELTYRKGNPMLRPQFTHSFEISPTYGGYPMVTLGYSHTKDVFTQIIDTADVRATFITNENLADQKNYTLTLNFPTPIAKWWQGFVSVTGYRNHFKATFRDDYAVDHAFSALNLYSEQNIRFPMGFGLQLSGWFNSAGFWGTLRNQPQGAMDLGIQKKVFNDRGELRLRFGDILHTAGWKSKTVFTPGLDMKAQGNWESKTVTLNFSYRFGSAEVKGARQRKTGIEDESRRVKGKN